MAYPRSTVERAPRDGEPTALSGSPIAEPHEDPDNQDGQGPVINTVEIANWRWIDGNLLTSQLDTEPERFTPWLKMEWQRLQREFPVALRMPK